MVRNDRVSQAPRPPQRSRWFARPTRRPLRRTRRWAALLGVCLVSVALLLPGAPGRADTLDDGAPAPAESLHPGCFKFDPFRWPAYDPRSCDHWADQCKLIGQSVAENFLITLCLAKCNGVTDRIDPYTWEGCGG